jgi:ankyrin repeat protein/Tfp pilus assembly protein PilF
MARGAQVDARDRLGRTPLFFTGDNKDIEIAELLLSHGADLHARTLKNSTVLHIVRFQEDSPLPEFLLSRGAEMDAENSSGATPLHLAAYQGKDSMVATLLAHGANMEAPVAPKGSTPIMTAISGGHPGTVQVLIAQGAQVTATDTSGATPLHYAAYNNELKIAELLLKHSALINARAKDGRTPLHSAVPKDNLEMIEFLISRGADIDAKDCSGRTALGRAEPGTQKNTAAYLSRLHERINRSMDDIRRLLKEKRYYAAWMASQKAIKEFPCSSRLSLLTAETCIRRGHLEAAYGIRRKLIFDHYPEHLLYERELRSGHLCREFGKFARSGKHYMRAHKEKPGAYEPLSGLYQLSHESGRIKDEWRCIENILARFPDDVYALQQKALQYDKSGRWHEAIAAFRRAGGDYSLIREGIILLRLGRAAEAKKILQKISSTSTEWTGACHKLVLVSEMMGDYEQAHYYLEALGGLDQTCLVEMKMADLYNKTGDRKKSRDALVKGLSRYIGTFNPEQRIFGRDLVALLLEKLDSLEQGVSLLHTCGGNEAISELKIKVLYYMRGNKGARCQRKGALEPSYVKKILEAVTSFFCREFGGAFSWSFEELHLRQGFSTFYDLGERVRFGHEYALKAALDSGELHPGEGLLIFHQDYDERDNYHMAGWGAQGYALIKAGRKSAFFSSLIAHELGHAMGRLSHTDGTADLKDPFSVMAQGILTPLSQTYINPFQKALMVTVPSVQKMVEEGKSLEERRLWRQAAKVYREALAEDPLYLWIYSRLGPVYDRLGEQDSAFNILKEAVKISPVSDHACPLMACFLTGKKARGKEEAFRHVPGFGECSHTHLLIGLTFHKRGDIREYLRNCMVAWWLDKTCFYATVNVACAYHQLHEYYYAFLWYRKALKINPLSPEVYRRLAYLEAQRGNMKAAVCHMEKAELLAPGNPETRYYKKRMEKAFRAGAHAKSC